MKRKRFDRPGPLAIAAAYWGREYELVTPSAPMQAGGVAVVMVVGPLTHRDSMFGFDTYDGIEQRVAAALATSADTVVLKIDSPGGEVGGAFECARTLRRMAAAAGKRLIAYVDELAGSAAYAIACACSAIYMPASGQVGAIGVIEMVADATAMDASQGVRYAVITSGAHKADGNPHVPLTDETRARFQGQVDELAQMFFALVAESRPLDVVAIQSLEASLFRGESAVRVKLADGIMNWDELLAMVASGAQVSAAEQETESTAAPEEGGPMEGAMTRAELLAAIKAAMEDAPAKEPEKEEGDKEMGAAEFKAALKALFAEDEPAPHKEPDGDEAPAARAESEPEPEKPAARAQEPEKEPAAAKASAESARVMAIAEEAKAALIASRPDLDAKLLQKESLEVVRRLVALAPKPAATVAPTAPAHPAAAAQVPAATRGVAQVTSDNPDMDRLMGLQASAPKVHWDGAVRVFPTMTPEQARAASKEGAK